jgi:hypothetical protein
MRMSNKRAREINEAWLEALTTMATKERRPIPITMRRALNELEEVVDRLEAEAAIRVFKPMRRTGER